MSYFPPIIGVAQEALAAARKGRVSRCKARVTQVGMQMLIESIEEKSKDIANKTARAAWALLSKGESYKATPAF